MSDEVGFFMTTGITPQYAFLRKNHNPYERDLSAPLAHILKVLPSCPLRIDLIDGKFQIYPARKVKFEPEPWNSGENRFPCHYNLVTFVSTPFNPETSENWQKFSLEHSFLNYLERGMPPHPSDIDNIERVCPEELVPALAFWLNENPFGDVWREIGEKLRKRFELDF